MIEGLYRVLSDLMPRRGNHRPSEKSRVLKSPDDSIRF